MRFLQVTRARRWTPLRISVVIPTCNEATRLKGTVAAIRRRRATRKRARRRPTGWGLADGEMPDGVTTIDAAPHDRLFPLMAAVVQHGGGGTTAAGLRAGCPTVTVPFFADQPFWGRRVAQLGAGSRPVPRRRLTPRRLGAAIDAATSDPLVRERARRLGRQIRSERGVERAVEIGEKWLRRLGA